MSPEELNIKSVDELWQEEQEAEIIKDLKNGKSLQEIMNAKDLIKPLEKPKKLTCCDDRCEHGMSVAGSGILMSEEAFATFMKNNPEIETITYHPDCGAAKVAFANRGGQEDDLPEGVTTPAELAKWFSESMANKYNKKCECIPADGHHKGAGVFVDLTNKFNPDLVEGMPHTYVSQSFTGKDENYVKNEISILTSIAFGDHGFGERITEENPFYIFICVKDETEKEGIISLAKEAVASYGSKVKVEAFVSSL